jgi:hypothetical protein
MCLMDTPMIYPELPRVIIDVYRQEIADRVEKIKQYQKNTALPDSVLTKPE